MLDNTTTEILILSLPIAHSTRRFNQLPQQPNFGLNRTVFGDNTLQRVYLLNVVGKRRLSVVELESSLRGEEVNDDDDADIIDDHC